MDKVKVKTVICDKQQKSAVPRKAKAANEDLLARHASSITYPFPVIPAKAGIQLFRGKGFTLIEMMIVVVIVGVLAAMAAPSFRDFIEKNRVKQITEEIYGFVMQAKSEVVTRDQNIFIDINTADPWCVGFVPDPDELTTCDCKAGTCIAPVGTTDVTQVISANDFPFDSTITGSDFEFKKVKSTTAGGTILISSGGWQLGFTHGSNTGRVRLCSPADSVSTKGISGYVACP